MQELKGKKVFFVGDSIAAQDGKPYDYTNISYNHDKLGEMCKAYPTLLKEKLSIEIVKNIAVGGHGIEDQKKIILHEDLSKADITIVAVGVNDFSRGTRIGNLPSTDANGYEDTFIGHYCELLDYVYKQNPYMKVILMTPMHKDTRHRKGDVPKHDISSINESGLRLKDYVDAVKKVGEFYACPVADMYAQSGLNRFNIPLFTFEGTHPTNEGYEYVIKVLLHEMEKLFC